MSEKERNFFQAFAPFVSFHIDETRVNIRDLIESWNTPGAIVRCKGPPNECIVVIDRNIESLGCIAGWISDEDEN